MSPAARRHRRADLPAMLLALDEAVAEALDGRVADPAVLARARAVGARAGERLRLSGEHTVVALAGSTGSGKSSLFNALAGRRRSRRWACGGRRRPRPHACVWGADGAAPLLEWLGVPRRQTALAARARARREDEPASSTAWCCSTCPTTTRPSLEHRLEVDRLVELVDLLVWVVDPQKYADEAAARALPAPPGRARRRDGRRAQPGRHG